MQVTDRGTGEPQLAVVGSIHGDEPAGKKAIEKIISRHRFRKPVRFIVANEKALEEDVRYLDSDLNRSFPGDAGSSSHEERLASEILEQVRGKTVLDLHTTHSYPEPFSTIKDLEDLEEARKTGAEYVIHFPGSSGAMMEHVDGTLVETGLQGTVKAVENAVEVVENFLAAHGAIEADYRLSDPEVYRYYETVEGDWEFLAENFERVEEGEVYARKGDRELVAEEDFYPVLMSTNGYDGQLGYKAEKVQP
ncbi:MAG: succinylglutamate desuccinylase/aspartoacylase family protein [Candidatus Nanohaloarchaea archaeon]